jgi:hypothetical protein
VAEPVLNSAFTQPAIIIHKTLASSHTIAGPSLSTNRIFPFFQSFCLPLSLRLGTVVTFFAMRLLYFNSSRRLTSADFSRKTIPPYAILSHTWDDDEFLFEDLVNGTGKGKAGYKKIMFCGEQADRDSLRYFWVDTCCIDKWKIPELSHAINSMFRWYKNAAKCYAFLSDVSARTTDAHIHKDTWEASFRKSKWFTRGWTLQELLAPALIDFFSLEGQRIGDKASLEQQICEITRIPFTALRGDALDEFSVPERMAWMEGRQTKVEEDMAYSLIGLFGVSMEFRYGEGKERALKRLEEEVGKGSTSIVLSDKVLKSTPQRTPHRFSYHLTKTLGLSVASCSSPSLNESSF